VKISVFELAMVDSLMQVYSWKTVSLIYIAFVLKYLGSFYPQAQQTCA